MRVLFIAMVVVGLIGFASMVAFVLRQGVHGRQHHEHVNGNGGDVVLRTGASSAAGLFSPALIPALATRGIVDAAGMW